LVFSPVSEIGLESIRAVRPLPLDGARYPTR
jgi:hypothetical protein